MGRTSVQTAFVKEPKKRKTMFTKRSSGFLKKAIELSVNCNCEIVVMIYQKDRDIYTEYQTTSDSMEKILQRRQKETEQPLTNEFAGWTCSECGNKNLTKPDTCRFKGCKATHKGYQKGETFIVEKKDQLLIRKDADPLDRMKRQAVLEEVKASSNGNAQEEELEAKLKHSEKQLVLQKKQLEDKDSELIRCRERIAALESRKRQRDEGNTSIVETEPKKSKTELIGKEETKNTEEIKENPQSVNTKIIRRNRGDCLTSYGLPPLIPPKRHGHEWGNPSNRFIIGIPSVPDGGVIDIGNISPMLNFDGIRDPSLEFWCKSDKYWQKTETMNEKHHF